ncbi:MAG: 50S ribosomal protein L11 methyltransferase [Clostridiales bacterium]|nr:50S ribosomal protein L11 methyltransferase [Clostridiales bacterium]
MNWQKMTVHTTTMGVDLVGELLLSAGANGIQVEDRFDALSSQKKDGMWDMIDEKVFADMPDDVRVTAYFPEDGSAAEKFHLAEEKLSALRGQDPGFDVGTLQVDTDTVRDEDWNENWKKWYKPLKVGNRIVIKPTWESYTEQPEDLVIELDPGMAFGTGSHETTAMCVRMLEKNVRPGDTCFDVGCGSGILALAAARLGAGECLAIDLDPVAVRTARENVALNGLAERVRVEEGDLLEKESGTADLIVANIIADVICYLCRPARRFLKDGGTFICSGIIREKEADVLHALELSGYRVFDREEQGEWVCLAARQG